MKKRKLSNGHKELLAAVGLMLIGVIVILIFREPPKHVEKKLQIGYTNTVTKVVEDEPLTPEEIEEANKALENAKDYINNDNLSELLRRVIGFTREDFDGQPPIHTQLMILLLMVNTYDIRESDGLDAINQSTYFIDKAIAKSILSEMFLSLDSSFEPVPKDLDAFVYYKEGNVYFRRLAFNTERTRITKSEEIEMDGEAYVKLHTITYMYDYMNNAQMVDLYECDVIVKQVEGSKYGFKIKAIENLEMLALAPAESN